MTSEAIKAVNEYLLGMAARGFVPVPETIEEIILRHCPVFPS